MKTDVLIVGGGIAGVSLAYSLARSGVDVVLAERGELNREASGTNAGSMHLQIAIHQLLGGLDSPGEAERLREETRLAAAAMELWRELDAELGLDWHTTGGLMVAETPEQLQLLHDKWRLEEEAGLETHVLEGEELRRFAPYLSERVIGATYCPAEGHVNPLIAVPKLAERAGVRVLTHAEVTAIEPGFRVTTTAGTIEADRIVNAAGAWATELQPELPMRALGLHVNVTEARARLLEPMIQHIGRRLTLKQADNGTFIVGGGWPSRETPGRWMTTWASAAGNAAVAVDVVPALADVRLLRTWSGVIAWTYDVSPIVGESREGFYTIVVGSSGYTLSPLFARMLAEQMTGGPRLPAEYSPERRTPA
jgi:glycine/D-amino acid oxidase-like deaminating enzyme